MATKRVTILRGTIIYQDGRAVREGETITVPTRTAAALVKHGNAVPAERQAP